MTAWWLRCLPAGLRARIAGEDAVRHALGNTGWQFADSLLRLGGGLLLGIWMARYLGPEQFGLLSYALALYLLFSALAGFGLDDILVRDVVRDPAARDEIVGTAFLLRLASGIVAFAGAAGVVVLLRPDDSLSHWLVGIIAAGLVFQAFNVIEYWFHSRVQARSVVLARDAAFLLGALFKIGLLLAAAPLVYFAWVALLEIAAGAAGLIVAYRYSGGRLRQWRYSRQRAVGLFRDSWPLMLSLIVITVYLRIDQVMLGEMVGDEEVGIYAVAVRFAEAWYFIPTALYWTLFAGIVEARAISDELFYARLQRFYNLAALAAYAVAVPVTLIAQWLVPTLFGEVYARGGLMLAVLIWANLFTGLEMARSAFLTTMNWTRLYLATVLLGCALNIALNYLLIPRYGGMGAAVASVISYWFAAHGACFLFRPLRRTGAMLTRALLCPKGW